MADQEKVLHTHDAPGGQSEPYEHEHIDPDCLHRWKTCPVHNPDGGVPSPQVASTCIYGGAALKDGGSWDESTSKDVWKRVAGRLRSDGPHGD